MSSLLSTQAWANINFSCDVENMALENNLAAKLLNDQNISINSVVGVSIHSEKLKMEQNFRISTRGFIGCGDRDMKVSGEVEVTFRDANRFCRQKFWIEAQTRDSNSFKSEASTPVSCR